MKFFCLGPLEVRRAGTVLEIGPPKRRALLLRLLLENGRTVPVSRLCEDLWEGRPPAGAVSSVHAHISRLRTVLEPGRARQEQAKVLLSLSTGYALRVPPEDRDTVLFERALERAHILISRRRFAQARHQLEHAMGMWRGVPLADARGQHFAEREAMRLEQLKLPADELHTTLLLQEGQVAQAVIGAEQLVERDPLREASWVLLMRALYSAGRPAEALRRYERVRTLLARDLGLDPGPALREMQLAVLRHDMSLLRATVPPVSLTTDPRPARHQPRAGRPAGTTRPLLGRDEEITRLGRLLDAAASGCTAWGVISGEPGVGKTRLTQELAVQAAKAGFVVAWARCSKAADAEAVTALAPVNQLLRDLRRAAPETGPAAGGRLHQGDAPLPGHAGLPSVLAQELLSALAEGPTLCVVEDVHLASPVFRHLLAHWADTLHDAPLAVLCTVSDDPDPGVEALLAALARHGTERVHLAPLTVGSVRQLLRIHRRDKPADGDAAGEAHQLHRLSGGNPFFLTQLLKAPGAGQVGTAAPIPSSAASVLRVRLAAVDPAVRAMLESAAVLGDVLEPDLVARMCGLPLGVVLEMADHAVAARLLVWQKGPYAQGTDVYGFSPGMVRQVILAGLTPSRRHALHHAAARVMEGSQSQNRGEGTAHAVTSR
ncbi:BREX system ATP-binding domain-containing protein [Streptomyces sp.]|uniref:BREX system ATP-binding domain-containing protein n=1 Tax=Streptomyces sp. TaxID=1931 RepID=UPI002F416F20